MDSVLVMPMDLMLDSSWDYKLVILTETLMDLMLDGL